MRYVNSTNVPIITVWDIDLFIIRDLNDELFGHYDVGFAYPSPRLEQYAGEYKVS